MSNDRVFKAYVNPLQFLEIDEPWASRFDKMPTAEDVLKFACPPSIKSDLESLTSRYCEISNEQDRLFAPPAEDRILNKLVWPLRHAKASYMFGNYLATVALCGMVGEMLALLIFDISDFKINDKVMSEKEQKSLFGSTFEKLNQQRRVAILRSFNIMEDNIKSAFDLIRTKRRKYLHFWSQDHASLPPDAIAVYQAAVSIAVNVIGQNTQDGKIVLNPSLIKYLERHGVIETQDDTKN